MKSLKVIWYSLIILFLFTGLLTGRREFFLLFFIFLFVVLYALVLNIWTILSFSYIQDLSLQAVVKGAVAHLKLGIYNDKPFPFTLMKVLVKTVSPDRIYGLEFNLPPNSNINFSVPLICPYRGVYGVGMTRIVVNDIFGLVRTRYDMRSLPYYKMKQLKILPRIIELPYLPTRNTDAKNTGKTAIRFSDDGDSFSELRRYRHGDPLKRIHRIISARKRELYVKSYDIPLETTALIAIDTAMELGTGEQRRYLADLASECAVAIADICMRTGYTVEFAGVDLSRSFRRRSKREVLSALCEKLAEQPFKGEGDIKSELESASVRAEGFRAIYVISTAQPSSFADVLFRLKKEGCHVCYVKVSGADEVTDHDGNVPGISFIPVSLGDDIRLVMLGEFR